MARSTTPKTDPIAALVAQVAALSAQLAELQGGTEAPKPAATPRPKGGKKAPAKGAKVYTWKPWACAKFGIPAVVGASFAYNGKNGTTDHVVVSVSADGIVSSRRA